MAIVGTLLQGRYRVVRPIARGAVATVYLAFDRFGTPYALKVFPKGLDARADREWRVGRALDHPNVNPVLERVEVAGHPAVLLAYAPGERLSDWKEAYPDAPFLPVFRQLLSALAHLHERGLVHRDVKPENLVISKSGAARLIDFDLSGPASERIARLRLGTLAYFSPEETYGRPPTPASDVYAAGVVLYWGLFGELPFVGPPGEVLRAHREAPPLPPPGEKPPAALWAYLERMLAKRPEERFPNAGEALKALPPEPEAPGAGHRA
ncbi:MAG TPA: serine/threonine protein kinase [Oceanithermus sp.]|nr:serine/threonine protein kinase [Oceanithermus sp.]